MNRTFLFSPTLSSICFSFLMLCSAVGCNSTIETTACTANEDGATVIDVLKGANWISPKIVNSGRNPKNSYWGLHAYLDTEIDTSTHQLFKIYLYSKAGDAHYIIQHTDMKTLIATINDGSLVDENAIDQNNSIFQLYSCEGTKLLQKRSSKTSFITSASSIIGYDISNYEYDHHNFIRDFQDYNSSF